MTEKITDIRDYRWIEVGSPEWQDEVMNALNEHTDRITALEAAQAIRCSRCGKAPPLENSAVDEKVYMNLDGWVQVRQPFQAWRCPRHIPKEIVEGRP